ncbi:alpha/beta fold hydrolase [Kribbella sp. NPDC051952]|uniref:alpha/beta hydrolase family protein n=1 Tax=Kribbella sp. NPDC051952 TaxID=3154851 RepID=UPI0034408F92
MITRRGLLTAVGLAGLAGCKAAPAPAPQDASTAVRYGSDEAQIAELHLPPGTGKVPAAVVIHGGFWMSDYGMSLASPLAADLATVGIAGYAIEYRRVGNGGGWPATFEDVAAAIDELASEPRVDLSKVVAIGHSAGGQLALWAAGRGGLPQDAPGASPRVWIRGAVSQAGVLDLISAYREQLGGSAVQDFLGTTPELNRSRYVLASPYERLPLKVPVALVHGTRDGAVPIIQSQRYRDAARAAGDEVTLTELPHVDHFELIDPHNEAWTTCRAELLRLLD